MSEQQLPLSGFGPIAAPTDRLFFALFPDSRAAGQIARLAADLRTECRLIGQPLKAERFNVRLHHLGDHAGLPSALVDAAIEAAASVDSPSFELAFDRAASLNGASSKPVVLSSGEEMTALMAFQEALGGAMSKAGLGRWINRDFKPHITLLYDRRGISEQPVPGVTWKASEFVLVHSLLGQTRHVVRGRWPLQP